MKKIILIIIFIFSFAFISDVSAFGIYNDSLNYFVEYKIGDEVIKKEINYFYKDTKDKFVYQLDLNEFYDDNWEVLRTGREKVETVQRMKRIMYYGYGYYEHFDIKFYVATQVLIWQLLYPEYDIVLLDENNDFKDEFDEISIYLEEDFECIPSFNNLKVALNSTLVLEDKNGFLEEAKLVDGNIDYKLKDSFFEVTGSKEGKYYLYFRFDKNEFKDLKVYLNEINYFVERAMDFSYYYKINIEVPATSFKIVSNTDCVWGLFDNNQSLIKEISINNEYISDIFVNDKYYISEISCNNDYISNSKKYYLNSGDLNEFYFEYKKKTKIVNFELKENYYYELIYNDKKISLTDSSLELEYGKYIFKNISTNQILEFVVDDDFDDLISVPELVNPNTGENKNYCLIYCFFLLFMSLTFPYFRVK